MLQHQSGRIHYLETFIKQRKKLFERLADIIRETKENCFTGFFIFQSHYLSLPFFCWFLNSHSYKVILSLLQLYFTKQLHNLTALSPDLSKNKQTSFWKHVTFPVKLFVLACKIHLLFKFLKLPCSHLTLKKQQKKGKAQAFTLFPPVFQFFGDSSHHQLLEASQMFHDTEGRLISTYKPKKFIFKSIYTERK